MTNEQSRKNEVGALPSENLCAGITVALAVYIIGLVLSMLANTSSGGSPLIATIKNRLFVPWMAPAWLDLGFDYHLTYGLNEDADHILRVQPYSNTTSATSISLPGNRKGEQANRWRRLAKSIASSSDEPDRDSILPTSIGLGLMDELKSNDVFVRVLRAPLPEKSQITLPLYETAGVRVRMVDGVPQLIPQKPQEELAPVKTSFKRTQDNEP